MATKYPYQIIRSNRKTLALEIKPDGSIIVRAPLRTKEQTADDFVREKSGWIEKHLQQLAKAQARQCTEKLSEKDIQRLAERAKDYIPRRAIYYAGIIGVTYGRITIRCQRTKWGSCSSKGNLNFNCLLMLMPPEVIDSVIVHELCHRKVMNHSSQFYDEVLRAYPDYPRWNRWLKDNGAAVMNRIL